MSHWFEIKNTDSVLSPALLFFPERINGNIQKMIQIAGSALRLRPHVKTYKCREIVALQMQAGISKFKCATLTEAEMLAEMGVKDILVAYPLVRPNAEVFLGLIKKYPATYFSTLVDDINQLEQWQNRDSSGINLYIDLNVGMNRTGISPSDAFAVYQAIANSPFNFMGLHVYDGHIRDIAISEREKSVDKAFKRVNPLMQKIRETNRNLNIELVCGGSISFPIHANYPDRQLSPGTTLLWDYGYGSQFSDLPFENAAVVMTRIISKPGDNLLCLDLGHKAIASEMSQPPVYFPQIPDAVIKTLSEEHMVIETSKASDWSIGDALYGFPWHICPTVALHEQAVIIKQNQAVDYWKIEARKRKYKFE